MILYSPLNFHGFQNLPTKKEVDTAWPEAKSIDKSNSKCTTTQKEQTEMIIISFDSEMIISIHKTVI